MAKAPTGSLPAGSTAERESPDGAPGQSMPLLPVQQRFFQSDPQDPHDFTITAVASVDSQLDHAALREAVAALVRRYDSLRTVYLLEADGWVQREQPIPPPSPGHGLLREQDLRDLVTVERVRGDEAEAADRLDQVKARHRTLRIDSWPLVRVTALDRGELPGKIVFTAHHLCCDAYSARILLRDLILGYLARVRGHPQPGQLRPGIPPTGMRDWARALARFAASREGEAEAAFWLGLRWDRVQPTGLRRPGQDAGRPTWAWVSSAVPEPESGMFNGFRSGSALSGREILQIAAAIAYRDVTGEPALLLDSVDLGRPADFPGVRLLRSVGWLTSVHPVLADLSDVERADPADHLALQLRAIRYQGVGWGALRGFTPSAAARSRIRELGPAPFYLNYQGNLSAARNGSAFPIRLESVSESLTPRQESYLGKLYPVIVDGRLQLGLSYRADVCAADQASAWVDRWATEVRRLLACQ